MTKVFSSVRRSGKTTAAIKEAAKHHLYILVPNRVQAKEIFGMALKMDLKIPYPITINEFMQGRVAESVKRQGIIVEEAQWTLHLILGSKIHMITVTDYGDDESE